MSELQTEYESRVQFNVIPAEETAQRMDEVNGFGFEAMKHGLVAFDADGEAVVKLPGHMFGKAEIDAAIRQVLAEG